MRQGTSAPSSAAIAADNVKHSTMIESNVETNVGNWRLAMNVTEVVVVKRVVGLNLTGRVAVVKLQNKAHVQLRDRAMGRVAPK